MTTEPCPCPDPECGDVHAHDVTARLDMKLDIPAMLAGLMKGPAADGD